MSGNGFKLSMAEFKGKVLESLTGMERDIKDIKVSNTEQHKNLFERIRKLEIRPSLSINPVGWILSMLGIKNR